jgi:hypothetical protein
MDCYLVDDFITLGILLAHWTDNGNLPANGPQGLRFLPDAPVKGYREILNNNDTGGHTNTFDTEIPKV